MKSARPPLDPAEISRLEYAYVRAVASQASRTEQKVRQILWTESNKKSVTARKYLKLAYRVPSLLPLQADWVMWTKNAHAQPTSQIYALRPTLLTIWSEAMFFAQRAGQWLCLLRGALALRAHRVALRTEFGLLPQSRRIRKSSVRRHIQSWLRSKRFRWKAWRNPIPELSVEYFLVDLPSDSTSISKGI